MSRPTPPPPEPLPLLPPSCCPTSYRQAVRRIEQTLNGCGDLVCFTPIGRKILDQTTSQLAVEVLKADLRRTNDCFTLPPPVPPSVHKRPGRYTGCSQKTEDIAR